MALISVVIPVLNEEKLLTGLLGQLAPDVIRRHDIEVIVSDGGSTDRTLEMARAVEGVRIVNASEKRTISFGRNAGAAVATGEHLVFLNADVRIGEVDRFFAAIPRMLAEPGMAGLTARVHVFPEEERFKDRAFHVVHNAYCHLLNAIGEGMGRGEFQALRRSLFHEVGGYNAGMAAGEDYDLFRRVRRHGAIRFIPGVVVYESPRRFRRYGYAHIVWGWTRNALSVIVKNRSSSESWDPVR